MIDLTWEQKLAAINALVRCELYMRKPGDWMLEIPGLGISDGVLVSYGVGLFGSSPEEVVESAWKELLAVDGIKKAIRIEHAPDYKAFYYVWNGFMWKDITDRFVARYSNE